MTRKLAREQAVSLIIRGFMDVGILGLPDALNAEIKRIVKISTESESPAKDVAKQKLTRK